MILENSVELCHRFNKESWLSIQHSKLQHSRKMDQYDLQYHESKNDDHNENITPPPHQLQCQRSSDWCPKIFRNVWSKLELFGQNVQTVIWPSRTPVYIYKVAENINPCFAVHGICHSRRVVLLRSLSDSPESKSPNQRRCAYAGGNLLYHEYTIPTTLEHSRHSLRENVT